MMKKKVTNRRIVAFVFLLTWLVFMLPAYVSATMPLSNEDATEQMIVDMATNFANPEDNAEFLGIQPINDDYLDQELWCVRWITPEHKLIEVKVDANSKEIVQFLDTTRKHAQNSDMCQMSEKIVLDTVNKFLSKLKSFGFNPIPENAEFMEPCEGEYGWQLSWAHVVDNIPVLGDFVRIRISQESGVVYSYTKCWHSVETMPEPLITCSDAISIAHKEDSLSINMTIQSDLNIVGRFLDSRVNYEPQLAWVLTAESQHGSTIVYYINARTGELVFRDSTLITYEDVFVRDHDTNGAATYECAADIFDRLDIATEGNARYLEDPTYAGEVQQFDDEIVLYHIGHGGYGQHNNEMETYLATETSNIWAADVENIDLTGMNLAFLCGCFTAATHYKQDGVWHSIDKNLADGFLAGGAECVFGWNCSSIGGGVPKVDAMAFSRYFFDYAVNGLDFETCYDHAYSYISQDAQRMAKMYGDDSLYLDEYDYAGDSWGNARNLGSGYDITFHVYDEGLWDPDVDWYRFTVTAYHAVDIWVVPNKDDLNVGFIVYDEYLHALFSRDAAGPGAQEWWYIADGWGTYFLYIYKTDDHGGYYDLTVTICS